MAKTSNIHINIKMKIACMFFAFFMWMYVMSDLDPVDTREISSVAVDIVNMNQIQENNLTLQPEQDFKTNIKIKGRRSVISKKMREGVKLQATIDKPKSGDNKVKIDIVGDTEEVSYSLEPKELNIKLEEKVTRSERIYVRSKGNLAQGYILDSMEMSQENTYVSGGRSLMEKLFKAEAVLDLEGHSSDFSEWTRVHFLDKEGNEIEGITANVPQIVVSVKVKREKEVPVRLKITDNNTDIDISGFQLEPSSVKVQLDEKDADVLFVETKPISMADLLKEDRSEVDLDIPEGIYVKERKVVVNTSKARKEFEEQSETLVYKAEDIEIINDANWSTEQLEKVVLKGNVNVHFISQENITKEDIELYVNTSQIEDGMGTIQYKSKKTVKELQIDPAKVETQEKEGATLEKTEEKSKKDGDKEEPEIHADTTNKENISKKEGERDKV